MQTTRLVAAGLAGAAIGALIGHTLTTTLTEHTDRHDDAWARQAVQGWMTRTQRLPADSRIELILQFPGCASYDVHAPRGRVLPVIAVNHEGTWRVSRALNETNDADEIHDGDDCRARATP